MSLQLHRLLQQLLLLPLMQMETRETEEPLEDKMRRDKDMTVTTCTIFLPPRVKAGVLQILIAGLLFCLCCGEGGREGRENALNEEAERMLMQHILTFLVLNKTQYGRPYLPVTFVASTASMS